MESPDAFAREASIAPGIVYNWYSLQVKVQPLRFKKAHVEFQPSHVKFFQRLHFKILGFSFRSVETVKQRGNCDGLLP